MGEIKHPSEDERRSHQDSKERDRRVIPRLSAPDLRQVVNSVRKISRLWIWASLIFVVVMVGRHALIDFQTSPRSIFFGVVILTLTFAMHRVSSTAKSYLENESQARIEKLLEAFQFLLFASATASLIIGSAYLITLF